MPEEQGLVTAIDGNTATDNPELQVEIGCKDVEKIAAETVKYFEEYFTDRTIRRIIGVNNYPNFAISKDEYRVALRTDTVGIYGYHYMLQTSNGLWAEKDGLEGYPEKVQDDSEICKNPSTHYWENRDSKTIYFAVSKPQEEK